MTRKNSGQLMSINPDENKTVFAITAEDVQDVAVTMINRRLTDYEMRETKVPGTNTNKRDRLI